ncbi:class I SAM-dependent methyltransferase [Mycolicibacterium hodleri]|uniref:Class I SAM-dependent methyltransferase n=1 Tax=Mycolicibacterium hodleri TaxID=49897 RepID=A0A502E5S4_9MYCO|nr:class I SAM-dependent methyltransferase [Mycolicibacterium hodleri]TPG32309.1 class I SAM-dependent methyltransferase [Mycolicibacterium hodleri]
MCLADGMDVGGLTPIEETALLTQYARALDSRRSRPILGDSLANEVIAKIDYDFASLAATPSVVCLVALRAKMLDARIRAFVAEHPDAVVVDIGAGFNGVAFRVDPPPTVDWYSVDLPAVIALRDELLRPRDHSHSVAASILEADWVTTIPGDRPTMVVADGLFAFLTEPMVVTALRSVTGHFESGVIAFNDYGPVSQVNKFLGKLATSRKSNSPHTQWNFPGFKDARIPETWNTELTLIEEASVMNQSDSVLFPPMLRLASRMATRIPAIARKARVLQYGF